MKGGYIVVRPGIAGDATATSVPGRVRGRRRRRPRLPAGGHLGGHRLHGGARRRQVPRATRRRRPLSRPAPAPVRVRAEIVSPAVGGPGRRVGCARRGRQPVPEPRVPRRARDAGCVGGDTGWEPRHLLLRDDAGNGSSRRVPRYEKAHSWGEFVFDWSWAQSYARAGLDYYPKQLAAIPFTPVTGPRLLVRPGAEASDAARHARRAAARDRGPRWRFRCARQLHDRRGPGRPRGARASCAGTIAASCGATVATATSRTSSTASAPTSARSCAASDGGCSRPESRCGACGARTSTTDLWRTIFGFSERTFLRHGNGHYLNAEFLAEVARRLPGTVVVKLAEREGTPLAAAVFLQGGGTLYGRYWGSAGHEDCLHFEVCYYQGIEHCIAHGLELFDPGTQGEHKLARGFAPTLTHSAHWLAHEGFHAAVGALPRARARRRARVPRGGRGSTCPSSGDRRRDSLAAVPVTRRRRFRRSRPRSREPDGLLCAGGDLAPERLHRRPIAAASFPWFSTGQPILWWSPDPRTVLYPAELHVSRSLAKTLRKRQLRDQHRPRLRCRASTRCADPGAAPEGTWITPQMHEAYLRLHQLGYAHSVETWDGEPAGGRALRRRARAACSSASRCSAPRRDASKVALCALVTTRCSERNYRLIDCQIASPHLASLGRAQPAAARIPARARRGDRRTRWRPTRLVARMRRLLCRQPI